MEEIAIRWQLYSHRTSLLSRFSLKVFFSAFNQEKLTVSRASLIMVRNRFKSAVQNAKLKIIWTSRLLAKMINLSDKSATSCYMITKKSSQERPRGVVKDACNRPENTNYLHLHFIIIKNRLNKTKNIHTQREKVAIKSFLPFFKIFERKTKLSDRRCCLPTRPCRLKSLTGVSRLSLMLTSSWRKLTLGSELR